MELFVDGKNVLEPVDLEKNKNEIIQQRSSVPKEYDFVKAKEGKILWVDAKVKAEDFNKLTTSVQESLVAINKRQAVVYDELDTIFNVIENIHKGSIEGIIIGVKSAQKAIEQSDYAIKQIKETLKILQKFKEDLEYNNEHLDDIDLIWENTQLLEERCNIIVDEINKKNNKLREELSKKITELYDRVKSQGKDISRIEESIKSNGRKFEEYKDKSTVRISDLENYQNKLKECKHILDVDEQWEYTRTLEKQIAEELKTQEKHFEDYKDKSLELIDEQKEETKTLKERISVGESKINEELMQVENKILMSKAMIKVLFFSACGLAVFNIVHLILNLAGVI